MLHIERKLNIIKESCVPKIDFTTKWDGNSIEANS